MQYQQCHGKGKGRDPLTLWKSCVAQFSQSAWVRRDDLASFCWCAQAFLRTQKENTCYVTQTYVLQWYPALSQTAGNNLAPHPSPMHQCIDMGLCGPISYNSPFEEQEKCRSL